MDFIQNYWKIILFVVVIVVITYVFTNNKDSMANIGECNKKSCGIDCECDEKCTNQYSNDKFSPCSCKGPDRMIF
jgi:hypothetical protein